MRVLRVPGREPIAELMEEHAALTAEAFEIRRALNEGDRVRTAPWSHVLRAISAGTRAGRRQGCSRRCATRQSSWTNCSSSRPSTATGRCGDRARPGRRRLRRRRHPPARRPVEHTSSARNWASSRSPSSPSASTAGPSSNAPTRSHRASCATRASPNDGDKHLAERVPTSLIQRRPDADAGTPEVG